jgi:hypothetical protein
VDEAVADHADGGGASAPIRMRGAGTDGAMPTIDLPASTMLEMKKPM